VARLVQYLRVLCGRLPSNVSPYDAKSLVDRSLWALFEDAKPSSLEIAVNARQTDEGTSIAVAIRPRRFLGVSIEEFSLDFLVG